MDIAFVILHYIVAEETCDCVRSIIEKSGTQDYGIVIVDNASPNNSYQLLHEEYKGNDRIHLIKNEENLGFARGCNVGYQYAKNQLSAEFIVLLNNDTELVQRGFYEQINRLYKEEGYAVLGPLILNKDGKCTSSPASLSLRTDDELARLERAYRRELKFIKFGLSQKNYRRFYRFVGYIKNPAKILRKTIPITKDYFREQHKNVRINGSCLVFSQEYIQKFDGLDNRTFMYFEEDILLLHIINNGLTLLYSPEVVIFHKEDSATDVVYSTSNKKRRFILENQLKSFEVYKQIKKEYEEINGKQMT